MEPISLELFNFGKHKHYLLQYQSGITGVTGENGMGKSTLVDAAQYFAITGQAPNRFKKEDILNWRAHEGKTVFKFTHDNISYKLSRTLHKAGATLHSTGDRINNKNNEIRGLSAVNEKMASILGMSFDIFRETCFAPQGSLCDVINMRHSERTAYFQRVTGLKKAEELREMLQRMVNNIPVHLYLEKNLKDAQKELQEAEVIYRQIGMQLRRLKHHRRKMEEDYSSSRKILDCPTKEEILEQQTDLLLKSTEFNNQIENIKNKITTLCKGMSFSGAPTCEENEAAARFIRYEDVRTKYINMLDTVGSIRSVKDLKKIIESNLIQQGKLKLKKELTVGIPCPTCGQDITQEFIGEDLDSKIKEHTSLLKEFRNELRTSETLAILKEQMEEYSCEKVDLVAFKAKDQTYRNYINIQEQLKEIKTEQHKVEIKLAKVDAELSMLDKVKTVEVYEKRLAQKILTECDGFDKRISLLRSDLSGSKVRVSERSTTINRLRTIQEKARKLEVVKIKFEFARDSLHRDNIPRLVMTRLVFCLNEQIEFYLSKFNTNFSAYLAEDFDFKCDFLNSGDANKSAFTSLSGGQKVALALAFRFALADVLGASVPILVLDEPTIHLDSANIEAMCDVFREVRGFAENRMYIFISTHEEALQKAFTRTLVV